MLKFLMMIFLLITIACSENLIVGKVVRVIDGDTFICNLRCCDIDIFCREIPVRLKGIDCPEIRGGSDSSKIVANDARMFTESMLKNAYLIELRNVSRDKYFRIDADVYCDGMNLTKLLIDKKYVK
jgi:endonuclease YncB( thermonuclease family)